jgi:hypothetical protein
MKAKGHGNGGGKGNGHGDGGGSGRDDWDLLEFAQSGMLEEIAIIVLAAVVGGGLVGAALRKTRLGWSWAPFVGVLVIGVAILVGEWRVTLAAACAVFGASAWGAGRSYVAYQSGGTKKARERRRIGPRQWIVRRLRIRDRQAHRGRGDRLAIGHTAELEVVEIPFGSGRGVHGLLAGATGAGKTTTASSVLQAHIRQGYGAVTVDSKGDDELERMLREEAERAGVPFFLWTPRGPAVYNPAARGGPSEVADKLLSAHEWSEPHYLSIALRFCQREVEVLRSCGVEPTLSSVARYMHPERLEALAAESNEAMLARVETLRADLPKRMLEELAGARSRIAVLAESEFGPWLLPSQNGKSEIDLSTVVSRGGVAYFRLEADRYQELGALLASGVIVDLVALTAGLQGGALRAVVFIDEFAAIGADRVSRLFATARSAGLSILLATQGLADMRAARLDGGADTLTSQVMQNVSYVVAHRISDPEAAQRLAEMAGTYETWTMTHEVGGEFMPMRTGSGSRIPTHEFHVHPNEFKTLREGEGVVIEPGRGGGRRARIWRPLD